MIRVARSFALPVILAGGLACAAVTALASDPEVDALKTQMRVLMDRVAAQEKELSGLRAQQAALLERLDSRPAVVASSPFQRFPAEFPAPASPAGKHKELDRRASHAGRLRVHAF